MSRNKHTPGPWHVSELNALGNVDPYSIFIEPNIAVIERKVAGQDQNDMADAHLIAAAPDLLEALQASRQVIATALQSSAPDWFKTEADIASHHTIKKIDAVLAKARGEQP